MRIKNKDASSLANVYENMKDNSHSVLKAHEEAIMNANKWARENVVSSNHSPKKKEKKKKEGKICTKCKQEVNESLIDTNYTLSTFNKTGVCKPCQDLHNKMYPNAKLNSEFGWII